MDHGLRRARLAERLDEIELEALIVTRLPNVRYLTGFTGSNAQVVVAGDGSAVFLTDGRYGAQSGHEVPDLPRTVYREGYPRPLVDACRTLGVTRAGFERRALTYEGWEQLTELAGDLELVPVGPEVERLRRTKDPEEIALIGRAQGFADLAFETVVLNGGLREGVTERHLALELEDAMVGAGAEDRAFDSIVAFADHAAEPHHHLTDRELPARRHRQAGFRRALGRLPLRHHAHRRVRRARPADARDPRSWSPPRSERVSRRCVRVSRRSRSMRRRGR